jgi:hypothetical protein
MKIIPAVPVMLAWQIFVKIWVNRCFRNGL